MSRTPLDALHRLEALAASGELARFCEAFAVEVLVVFGSTVDRQRATAARDLDVAVQFRAGGTPRLLQFAGALEELVGYMPVDVMDLRAAGVIGRFKALGAGIPMYEALPGSWGGLQAAAVLEYMDTAALRRLDRQLLKESA